MSTIFNRKNLQLFWKVWQVEVFLIVSTALNLSTKWTPKPTRLPLINSNRLVVKMPRDQLIDCLLMLASGLFDHEFYASINPDVPRSLVKAIKHYHEHGGIEGWAPSSDFDGAHYLTLNRDVRDAGMNPLVHFIKHGSVEGRLDALRNPQPPMICQGHRPHGETQVCSAVVEQMAAFLRSVSLKESSRLVSDIIESTRIVCSGMQECITHTIEQLEQTQLFLYKRNIDYERTMSLNERMMMELSLNNDQRMIDIDRNHCIQKSIADLEDKARQMAIDLEDANRTIVYWRRKTLDQQE